MQTFKIAQVAVAVPLRRKFDFLFPSDAGAPITGMRVEVPFGRRKLIGIVMAVAAESDLPESRLRRIIRVVDHEPVYPTKLLGWLNWIAGYYHHPIGEVLSTAMPAVVRRGGDIEPPTIPHYVTTSKGAGLSLDALARAPVQKRILRLLRATPNPVSLKAIKQCGQSWKRALTVLLDKEMIATSNAFTARESIRGTEVEGPPELNQSQLQACQSIYDALGDYACFTLYGVTGSGKTEVYLRTIAATIARGEQALILVPEIGLTPQLIARFRNRFRETLVVMHSNLSDGARHRAWAKARCGQAVIVLGTRSAVFTPLKHPGIIIIDEEHDLSYKQQDGLRYHARDIGIYRATLENIPIVLGSATPSLETLANIRNNRYTLLKLEQRAGGAALPNIGYVDLRRVPMDNGLSRPLLDAIRQRLENKEQSLIFINRRGFAPVLFCNQCSWQARCQRCDAKLIYHRSRGVLRCHHCGFDGPAPPKCPDCGSDPLMPLGQGTERIEEVLRNIFPAANILRFDRDNIRRKGQLEAKLEQVNTGDVDILVGTQILTKGHHFPKVTLVGIIDADQGLYSIDFRATEHLFQQIVQVAGRAGRADRPGAVLIQTVHPDHPHFDWLNKHDYTGFAEVAMQERSAAQYPPFSYFALLRAESTQQGAGLTFLEFARSMARKLTPSPNVIVMEPVPAPMEKRAGRYRAQLLLIGANRPALHELLKKWVSQLEDVPQARKVRWSIDIDPMEMY